MTAHVGITDKYFTNELISEFEVPKDGKLKIFILDSQHSKTYNIKKSYFPSCGTEKNFFNFRVENR